VYETNAQPAEPGARSPEPGNLERLLEECRRHCLRRGLTPDTADEVVQILALSALQGGCRDIRHRAAWLNGFVWRTLTRLRSRESREGPILSEPAATVSVGESAQAQELLNQLPGLMRRALELRYLQSRSTVEAAHELGMSQVAFRVLCSRARAALRERK